MNVGLLDSGIGGWSFLSKVESAYPNHTYLYFADQKNCPYGNKSLSELGTIVDEWIAIFKEKELDILILACNTITAHFKTKFQEELEIPVFGTTDGLEKITLTKNKTVLLATIKTVESDWYDKIFLDTELKKIGNVWLANTIENDFILSEEQLEELKKEINEQVEGDWSELILGCTHYPLVNKQLATIFPSKKIIDPADTIVAELQSTLSKNFCMDHNIIMSTSGDLNKIKEQSSIYFNNSLKAKIKFQQLG